MEMCISLLEDNDQILTYQFYYYIYKIINRMVMRISFKKTLVITKI